MEEQDKIKNAKKSAAEKAVGYIENGMTVGLGTGSTAYWAIQKIGELVKDGLQVRAIATSIQSETLAREIGISLTSFEETDHLDVTIDGADEADENLNLIKGGGGALVREKIVGAASKLYIIVVDEKKIVDQLGKFPLPVEVIRFGWQVTLQKLKMLNCNPELRASGGKTFETDNGNYILDCSFGSITQPKQLQLQINTIPGVVENGLFIDMADIMIIGYNEGGTKIFKKKS